MPFKVFKYGKLLQVMSTTKADAMWADNMKKNQTHVSLVEGRLQLHTTKKRTEIIQKC